jgi:hypothetical protein
VKAEAGAEGGRADGAAELTVGSVCTVHGLTDRPDLNGRE